MKRLANTFKGTAFLISLATIVGLTAIAGTSASAQDIYQIEQQTDVYFKTLIIDEGWDVRLIQAPAGSPTTIVLSTSCPEYYEEGNEPSVFKTKNYDKMPGDLLILPNNSMPRSTIVEIHTAQPIKWIHLFKNARLTIEQYNFDSVKLDIDVDSGAVLTIDSMQNRRSTDITLHDATLDLRHARLDNLNIEAHGNSVVNKGEIWSNRQRINLSENTISNVTTTDSANHLYVKRNQRLDKSDLFTSLSLTFGLDLGFPIAGTTNAHHGSPYNTGIDLTFNMVWLTNQISLGGRWSWDVGMLLAYHAVTLDNVVKPSGSTSLVLDASYGATPPHQQLLYTTLGLPVSLRYSLPKKYRPWFRGFHASLTPMVNFKQELSSQSLGSNNRWHTNSDKDLDLFNRFNVRAEVGMDVNIFGFHSVDFFIDLLPSYKPAANAPQMRMMGLIYHF